MKFVRMGGSIQVDLGQGSSVYYSLLASNIFQIESHPLKSLSKLYFFIYSCPPSHPFLFQVIE